MYAGPSAFESLHSYNGLPPVHPPATGAGGTFGPQSAGAIYLHIHETSTKRISTLNYLRKA
jgi:hypothetical protein